MIKLLKLLIFGHVHEWEVIREVELRDEYGGVGTRYIQKCKHCGAIKKWDMI